MGQRIVRNSSRAGPFRQSVSTGANLFMPLGRAVRGEEGLASYLGERQRQLRPHNEVVSIPLIAPGYQMRSNKVLLRYQSLLI